MAAAVVVVVPAPAGDETVDGRRVGGIAGLVGTLAVGSAILGWGIGAIVLSTMSN